MFKMLYIMLVYLSLDFKNFCNIFKEYFCFHFLSLLLFLIHQEKKEPIANPNFCIAVGFVGKTDKLHKILANIRIIFLKENHIIFAYYLYFSFDENAGYHWQAYFRSSQHCSHNSKN